MGPCGAFRLHRTRAFAEGISALAITVGDIENEAMELEQVERKGMNKPYFERIDYDLSMPLARQVRRNELYAHVASARLTQQFLPQADALAGAQEYTAFVMVQRRQLKASMKAAAKLAARAGAAADEAKQAQPELEGEMTAAACLCTPAPSHRRCGVVRIPSNQGVEPSAQGVLVGVSPAQYVAGGAWWRVPPLSG